MPYTPLPVRVVKVVAYCSMVTAFWDGECGQYKMHVARKYGPRVETEPQLPNPSRDWEGKCEQCGAAIPWQDAEVRLGGGTKQIWDTPSGNIEPGCMYWMDDYRDRCLHWDNCEGRHLHAVLPNGHPWDIDSRARNCNRPDDRQHRCWVRTGEPPNITVGKGGNTCSAGAGSIVSRDYHGFLINGVFTAS